MLDPQLIDDLKEATSLRVTVEFVRNKRFDSKEKYVPIADSLVPRELGLKIAAAISVKQA